MSTKPKPIPEGYHTATPYLIVQGAAKAIEYYKQVFGAKEVMRLGGPDGKVGHAELQIGDSKIMMADEAPQMGARGPKTVGGSPVILHVYVDDVDAVFNRAVANGAKILQPIENKFYGDRAGSLEDPFGHLWSIGTHIEDVTPEEIGKRAAAMMPKK